MHLHTEFISILEILPNVDENFVHSIKSERKWVHTHKNMTKNQKAIYDTRHITHTNTHTLVHTSKTNNLR